MNADLNFWLKKAFFVSFPTRQNVDTRNWNLGLADMIIPAALGDTVNNQQIVSGLKQGSAKKSPLMLYNNCTIIPDILHLTVSPGNTLSGQYYSRFMQMLGRQKCQRGLRRRSVSELRVSEKDTDLCRWRKCILCPFEQDASDSSLSHELTQRPWGYPKRPHEQRLERYRIAKFDCKASSTKFQSQ